MTLNRQAAILLMILIGSTTEAGHMLAPSITWPVMLLALPIWEGPKPSGEIAAEGQPKPIGK
jgi:hypothetical protein